MSFDSHNKVNLVGIASIGVCYFFDIIFNALAGVGTPSIFYSSVGNLSAKYNLDITPAGWAFSIWAVIYTWLGMAIIFYIATIFLKNNDGGKLYLHPEVVDIWYSIVFSFNLILNLTWIFVWDREELVTSCVVLYFIFVTNVMSIGFMAKTVADGNHDMMKTNPKLYWGYVVFSMNGQAVYAAWSLCASTLNLGHSLRYVTLLPMKDVSNICLSILLVLIVAYFLLENTVLDKYARFIMTPYLVIIWATTAMVTEKTDDELVPDQTKMFVASILSVACGLLVLRIFLVSVRQWQTPIGHRQDTMTPMQTITSYGSIY